MELQPGLPFVAEGDEDDTPDPDQGPHPLYGIPVGVPFNPDPYLLLQGDVRSCLQQLPADSIQTVVTSPPYWGLRNYGIPATQWRDGWEGCLGNEPTPAQFVAHILEVFAEVHRVLRPDGLVWLNLGDTYTLTARTHTGTGRGSSRRGDRARGGLKGKDLAGIPWMTALALRDQQGWYLRSDIVWSKPNPMPESVVDRPTRSHEYLFLLAKSPRYFYDRVAVLEPYAASTLKEGRRPYTGKGKKAYAEAGAQDPSAVKSRITARLHQALLEQAGEEALLAQKGDGTGRMRAAGPDRRWEEAAADPVRTHLGRNKRTVWHISPQPFRGAHFATFPTRLVEPCIRAGSSEGGQCSACGIPYRRITRRAALDAANKDAFEAARARTAANTGRTDGYTNYKPADPKRPFTTMGWMPGCGCPTGQPVPQIVLDPFCGSGRSGMVALREGRRFVGIDIKAEYLDMAKLALDTQLAHFRCTVTQNVSAREQLEGEVA